VEELPINKEEIKPIIVRCKHCSAMVGISPDHFRKLREWHAVKQFVCYSCSEYAPKYGKLRR
jgi:hypothetical protein